MNKITAEQLVMAYNKLTGEALTLDSPRVCRAELRNILAQVWERVEDNATYVYPSVREKAAVQCLLMARCKPFPDRNAQTAALCAMLLLELNGVLLRADDAQVRRLLDLLHAPDTESGDVLAWINESTLPDLP